MKRLPAVVLTAILLCFQMPTVQAVGTCASASVLMDGESGRVLYQENCYQPNLIASTTKLMTALVAVRSGVDPDQVVTVPDEAVGVEGSSIYLQKGERITLKALLYGMLLKSGNDAATAVAIVCGGSVEEFVSSMNRTARELGMEHTHFENPTGLDGETHYSSAYDMALLARACLADETVSEIVSTSNAVFGQRSFSNHNKLLRRYEGCVGMKTGYTQRAGRTLVSAARRGGMTLIAVTLNDPNDWNDHESLLDYGFSNYAPVVVAKKGESVGRLPVVGSLDLFAEAVAEEGFCYPVGQQEHLRVERCWKKTVVSAPIEQGEKLGVLKVWCGQELVGEIPLVAAEKIENNSARDEGWLSGILRGIINRMNEG